MALSMTPLIKTNQALTYIDDTILQAQNKAELFEIIPENHSLVRTAGLNVSPERTFFFLQKLKFLEHIVSNKGIQPIAKRVRELKNLKAPENKRDVMKLIGSFGWYSHYIKNLRVNCNPLYELTHNNTPFHWTSEHEQVFKLIEEEISSDTVLAIPDVRYPFHIHMVSSNVGTGSILVQDFPEGKRVVSINSRIFDKTEEKLSTMHRELFGIVSALKTYEHYIIGSPHTIYIHCNHKPNIYLWARKGNVSATFFHFDLIILQFQNLKIIWTPGKNLAFPDILSRNVTITDTKNYQKKHKSIPKDIKFYDDQGQEVKYCIEHDDEGLSSNDFSPFYCTTSTDKPRLLLKNDGHDLRLLSLSQTR